MHLQSLTVLALSSLSLLINAVPLIPKAGNLQRHRRRLVDYPVRPAVQQRAHRRDSTGYSVVLVNGGSGATSSAPVLPAEAIVTTTITEHDIKTQTVVTTKAPVTQTTTQPAKTQTITETSIETKAGVAKTILITHTQINTAGAPATTLVVTKTEQDEKVVPTTVVSTRTLILLATDGPAITPVPSTSTVPSQSSFPTMSLSSVLWRNSSIPITPTPVTPWASSISTMTATKSEQTPSLGARDVTREKIDGIWHEVELDESSGEFEQYGSDVTFDIAGDYSQSVDPEYLGESDIDSEQSFDDGLFVRDEASEDFEQYGSDATFDIEGDYSQSIDPEYIEEVVDVKFDYDTEDESAPENHSSSVSEMAVELGRSVQVALPNSPVAKEKGNVLMKREREVAPQFGATDLTRAEIEGLKRFMR